MRTIWSKTLILLSGVAVAAGLVVPAISQAAINQTAQVKLLPLSGTLPAQGNHYMRLSAYLATRDPTSTRTSFKPNPVGTVKITFSSGTTANPLATAGCKLRGNSAPAKLVTVCLTSQVGDGWALVSNLGVNPLSQISGAPAACPTSDATQYARTYSTATPTCTPRGFIWVHIRAYQGTGDGTRVVNRNSIIFANDNRIAPISFAGTISNNVLAVQLPALNGTGSQPGELPLGAVLVDFKLNITKTNYLKLGTCPSSRKVNVASYIKFSRFGRESTPAPAPVTINTLSGCRA